LIIPFISITPPVDSDLIFPHTGYINGLIDESVTMPDPENKLFTKSLPAFLARTQFGQILERVSKHHDRFLVTKNGEATAVILGVDDFLQAIAQTPEALAALHEQARRSGASRLSLEDIEAEIAAVRAEHHPHVS
jgi:prevent-host-death family protein